MRTGSRRTEHGSQKMDQADFKKLVGKTEQAEDNSKSSQKIGYK